MPRTEYILIFFIIIIIIIIIIMALQPFVGPWPLFQFLDPIHSPEDSLDGGSARRKAPAYTQNDTNTKSAHRHYSLSGIRTHDPSVRASERRQFMP
jgi:hypothetical protein